MNSTWVVEEIWEMSLQQIRKSKRLYISRGLTLDGNFGCLGAYEPNLLSYIVILPQYSESNLEKMIKRNINRDWKLEDVVFDHNNSNILVLHYVVS